MVLGRSGGCLRYFEGFGISKSLSMIFPHRLRHLLFFSLDPRVSLRDSHLGYRPIES
jgi:hypothetical protein